MLREAPNPSLQRVITPGKAVEYVVLSAMDEAEGYSMAE
jgi:hypothetical protein